MVKVGDKIRIIHMDGEPLYSGKVGIVEQLEEASLKKGIVERDVVRIITPGCNIDVKEKDNNVKKTIDHTIS